MPDLINFDQTGFISGRQTQDNIRRTLHIISHIQDSNLQAVLLSLDAEKAFDSVNWLFLKSVLSKFNFHAKFIQVIQTIYSCPSARIKINGDLSKSFTLGRGTRQGCPLSPLLFALFIEPLGQCIRQNSKIKGINFDNDEHKASLFADDILVYLKEPTESCVELMENILKIFGSLSGFKLNILKTQVLTFNYNPPEEIKKDYCLKWDLKYIKYLGIHIPKDLKDLEKLNYDPINKKIKLTLQDGIYYLSLI